MSDCFDHMQDAWDDALFGATANGMGDYRPLSATKTCKACGKRNLKWVETPHGWRLHDSDALHVCKEYTFLTGGQ